jgi:DNA segregation ATPase FtsK/SpoIIIE-like protein
MSIFEQIEGILMQAKLENKSSGDTAEEIMAMLVAEGLVEDDEAAEEEEEETIDPLYHGAIRVMDEVNGGELPSISLLQRRLQIGYNRSVELREKLQNRVVPK